MSPFYSPQSVGLMGLSLVILGPLSCDPERGVETRWSSVEDTWYQVKMRWAGWLDLNNQSSVDWRLAELAGLTWTINPASTEDLLSWLAWLEQSLEMVYPCQSNNSSVLACRKLDKKNSIQWSYSYLLP